MGVEPAHRQLFGPIAQREAQLAGLVARRALDRRDPHHHRAVDLPEVLLVELRQRIREVRQGTDGLLYLLTDEKEGAVLRIEPVQ